MRYKDLTGQRFGRLTAIRYSHTKKSAYWICKCDCGNEICLNAHNLRTGNTRSCGCLAKDTYKYHGKSKQNGKEARIHLIWRWIKRRCYNPKDSAYKLYGGRGIKVCAEWVDDFNAFYEWAMCNGYTDNLTLDRIDNNIGYYPNNCRWVTMKEQQRNRRNNVLITYKGVTKNLSAWAEMANIQAQLLSKRLKYGWSIEDALNVRPYKGNSKLSLRKRIDVL